MTTAQPGLNTCPGGGLQQQCSDVSDRELPVYSTLPIYREINQLLHIISTLVLRD